MAASARPGDTAPDRARGDVILRRRPDFSASVKGLGRRVTPHLPGGPEWGYKGSVPTGLALWILADRSGDPDWAERHCRRFMREVLARIPPWGGRIPADRIRSWIAPHGGHPHMPRSR